MMRTPMRRTDALRAENTRLREALNEAGAIAMAQMIEHSGCTGDICAGRFNAAMDIYDAIASLWYDATGEPL